MRGLRVLGAPDAPVARIALSRGFLLVPDVQKILRAGDVDLFVAGDPVEWEAFPYVADLVTAGRTKGMILLGSCVSEEPELAGVAAWLETLLPEVPVRFMPAGGEPFTAFPRVGVRREVEHGSSHDVSCSCSPPALRSRQQDGHLALPRSLPRTYA